MNRSLEAPDGVPTPPIDDSAIFALERPDPKLWTYYLITSFAAGPFFFIPLLFRSFRYNTLRYSFDEEGISMRWGVLFHREINLTYNRIQDIHLSSNTIARWLGLAEVQVQTASGSSKAEMTIEGMLEFEAIRDFLYSRMRGTGARSTPSRPTSGLTDASADEIVRSLQTVVEELRALRGELERRREGDR